MSESVESPPQPASRHTKSAADQAKRQTAAVQRGDEIAVGCQLVELLGGLTLLPAPRLRFLPVAAALLGSLATPGLCLFPIAEPMLFGFLALSETLPICFVFAAAGPVGCFSLASPALLGRFVVAAALLLRRFVVAAALLLGGFVPG